MFTVKTKQVKKTFQPTKTKSESKKPELKISKDKTFIQKKVVAKSVKSVLLHGSEKKSLTHLNSRRRKENKSMIDEISYDSYLNFKNSLSLIVGKQIHLDYDLFEAIVKRYKIKTV
jgi:hypothetical protein